MAEQQDGNTNSSSGKVNEDSSNVIIVEGYDGSLQGLKPVAPGASSEIYPMIGNNRVLPGQSDGAELSGVSCPKYVIVQESPSGASTTHSRGCSFDKRSSETSGSISGYGGALIQQQLLQTQQMCLQQQQAMSSLNDSVTKLRQSMEVRKKRDSVKRRIETVSFADWGNGNSDHDGSVSDSNVLSDVSEGNFSSDSEASSDDEGVGVAKRQKLQIEETEGETQKEENKTESDKEKNSKKFEKLKLLGSHFKKEKKYANSVHEMLASTVNQGIEAVVDHKSETVQNLLKKFERPENCQFLEVPKVNKAVWTSKQTSKGLKESDRLMQRTQNYLSKGLIPLVQIMDKSLKSESEESEEIFDLAMNSFNLLAFSHRDLSNQRRRLLGPAIAGKYKQLCNETAPISATHLFGEEDNLEKRVKEIDESRKLGNKINLFSTYSQQKEMKGYSQNTKSSGYKNSRSYKDSFKSNQNQDKSSHYNYKDHFWGKKAQSHQNKKSHKKGELGHHRK